MPNRNADAHAPSTHETPATDSTERVHVLDESCWCGPEVKPQPNGDVVVHRRPSIREQMANLSPEQEAERQRLLATLRAGASTVGQRLRERAAARAFGHLLDRSSIGSSAWVECPDHGRQPRDPFTERCVRCP